MLSHILFHFWLTPLSCCQMPQNDMTNDSATGLKRNGVFIIYYSRITSQALTCHIIACCSYMRLLIWNASNEREILMINEQAVWLSPLYSTLHSRLIQFSWITVTKASLWYNSTNFFPALVTSKQIWMWQNCVLHSTEIQTQILRIIIGLLFSHSQRHNCVFIL